VPWLLGSGVVVSCRACPFLSRFAHHMWCGEASFNAHCRMALPRRSFTTAAAAPPPPQHHRR
jgi:hypothetical protein